MCSFYLSAFFSFTGPQQCRWERDIAGIEIFILFVPMWRYPLFTFNCSTCILRNLECNSITLICSKLYRLLKKKTRIKRMGLTNYYYEQNISKYHNDTENSFRQLKTINKFGATTMNLTIIVIQILNYSTNWVNCILSILQLLYVKDQFNLLTNVANLCPNIVVATIQRNQLTAHKGNNRPFKIQLPDARRSEKTSMCAWINVWVTTLCNSGFIHISIYLCRVISRLCINVNESVLRECYGCTECTPGAFVSDNVHRCI